MVRGELPFQKCRVALDSVEFSDRVSGEELASNFADIITQMAQDAKWLVESMLFPLRLFQGHCEYKLTALLVKEEFIDLDSMNF
ncbi:hypothetical protein GH714_040353 [Hevea brasiliensis]|uniref:Uncharacterized protein n=1 Tax=Hevea brasiliensis TaxID=3981 RepID=A0A6A6MUG8_HEVBR|nr:hypothetical protein GH714_040353 [Hevea brasiliensis]